VHSLGQATDTLGAVAVVIAQENFQSDCWRVRLYAQLYWKRLRRA
jgi:hypothetical protein